MKILERTTRLLHFLAGFFTHVCQLPIVLLIGLCGGDLPAWGLPVTNLLADRNGDRIFSVFTFGDSITFGEGDTRERGGYPSRLKTILDAPVRNDGLNGEVLATNGIRRLRRDVRQSRADLVILNEGNSDAYERSVTEAAYRTALSQAIAYVKRQHKNIVVLTQYPEKYLSRRVQPRLDAINLIIKDVSRKAGVKVVDVDRAWRTTCISLPNCTNLLYRDGLHPNSTGYDVIAATILATLGQIDIFKQGGAQAVEAAFGLRRGAVIVKADFG